MLITITAGMAAMFCKSLWGAWNSTQVENYDNFKLVEDDVELDARQKGDLWCNILARTNLVKGVLMPARHKDNGGKTRYNDYETFFIDVVSEAMKKCDLKEKFRQAIMAIKASDARKWLSDVDGWSLAKNFLYHIDYDAAAVSEKIVTQCIEHYHEKFKADWQKANGKALAVEKLIIDDVNHLICTSIVRGWA